MILIPASSLSRPEILRLGANVSYAIRLDHELAAVNRSLRSVGETVEQLDDWPGVAAPPKSLHG